MSLFRAILLAALVGLAPFPANAEQASDYLMDYWSSDDGLPDSSVTGVTQTPNGYLWIGTYNGLARFDGMRFKNFDPANTPELKNARVTRLFRDERGTVWINTYDDSVTSLRNGKFQYEWQGAQIVNVFSTSNRIYLATIASGIATREEGSIGPSQWQTIALHPQNPARFFCQDREGAIWCLLRDGSIEKINGTNVAPLTDTSDLQGQTVYCLSADRAGQVWAGTDKKILRWNGRHFEDETPTNGNPSVATTFLYCTDSGGIWGFTDHIVRHALDRQWDVATDSWHDLIQGSSPIFVHANEDRDGNVWFRQYGQGLFCANANGKFWRLSSANGFPDNRATCWFQDLEGNLWIGAEHGGLVRLRKRQFQNFGGDWIKNAAVSTVCEDSQSNIWIGTLYQGLNRWSNGSMESFDLPKGGNKKAFFSVSPGANGRVWLSADHEDLFYIEGGKISTQQDSLHGIKVIFTDSKRRVWLGRRNQLSCLTTNELLNFNQPKGSDLYDVRALAEDREGNIWIGTGNGILYKFADGKFSAFNPDTSSEMKPIWSLMPDTDGTIWVGTFRGGLLHFRYGKFTRYTTHDGLPSDIICQIVDDGLGKLWFGSHKGIFYVAKNSFAAFERGEIHSLRPSEFGLSEGLPTLECSGGHQPSAWRAHDGQLWFATVKGAVAVTPDKIQFNSLAPPVVIEGLSVDGKQFSANSPVKIPAGKRALDFEFTALSFIAPDKVRFRYRLEGLEDKWVEAGTKRTAHYSPLVPGNYTFRVIACNNDGVWNETGASLALTQLAFFWETRWFEFSMMLITLIAASVGVRYLATRRFEKKLQYLQQQRAIERERERIAQDIHDDLGAGLTQIMLQSSIAQRESPSRMQCDLAQISETARDLVRAMDEIVWAINPENDTLDSLVSYVGKHVQEYLSSAKIRCRLDFPAETPPIAVPAETRHNLFLAIKEVLHNIVKHSRATEVKFDLKLLPDAFVFTIHDNGVGFVQGAHNESVAEGRISSGHGLGNLAQRLKDIGGDCSILSDPGKGTRIELRLPATSLP
jgi:signal transduction histidine kinase/ligand-binding sensor domain-containing protein